MSCDDEVHDPGRDPLMGLAESGVRLVWVADIDGDVLVLEGHRLVLADADLTRWDVAERLVELLLEPQEATGAP